MTHRQEQILPFSFGTTIKENQNTRGRTMGLQNIFDMVKADRYTQDGREEIIKAQKETEDARRTYKNGEISEKTGLMKTSNGWVKPKSGEQTGAKTGHGESPKGTGPLSPAKRKAERIAKIQKETGKAAPYGRTLKGTPKTPDDNPLTERTQARVESKPAAEKAEFSAEDLPEVGQKITFNWKDKGMTGIKGTVVGFKTINGKTYARVRGEDKSLSPNGEFNVNLQILKSDGPRLNTNKGKVISGNVEQKNGIWEPIYGEPADSAPLVLTGDTRIRVRKS